MLVKRPDLFDKVITRIGLRPEGDNALTYDKETGREHIALYMGNHVYFYII